MNFINGPRQRKEDRKRITARGDSRSWVTNDRERNDKEENAVDFMTEKKDRRRASRSQDTEKRMPDTWSTRRRKKERKMESMEEEQEEKRARG